MRGCRYMCYLMSMGKDATGIASKISVEAYRLEEQCVWLPSPRQLSRSRWPGSLPDDANFTCWPRQAHWRFPKSLQMHLAATVARSRA